jgi:hypothetical protein
MGEARHSPGTLMTHPSARKIAPCQALSPRAYLCVISVVNRPRTLSLLREIGFVVRPVSDSIGKEDSMVQQVGNGWRARGAVVHGALLALMMTVGCAVQSEMTDLWKDPTFPIGPMHNVLVVAVRKDPVRRRMWEDAFVSELGARGLTATSSYQLFQDAPPDTQEVIEAVRKNGYDAVLVSIRRPNETTSTFVPGNVRRESVTREDYYGVFHTYLRDVQDPGHTEIDEIRLIQTDVWTTGGNGHLVWSGTLRTLDSVTNRTMETTVSKDIIPVMEKQGVVPKKKK